MSEEYTREEKRRRICAVPYNIIHYGRCVQLFGLEVLAEPHGFVKFIYIGNTLMGYQQCNCGHGNPYPTTYLFGDPEDEDAEEN